MLVWFCIHGHDHFKIILLEAIPS